MRGKEISVFGGAFHLSVRRFVFKRPYPMFFENLVSLTVGVLNCSQQCERTVSILDDIRNLLDSGENELTELHGDGAYGAGDFRSRECLELLDEADVVVTNPSFSLFREYVATLVEHDKKFVIIGNQNAITYKEIFPLLRDSRLWLGYGFRGNVAFFGSPYEDTAASVTHLDGHIRVSGVMWYTNLDIDKRHEDLILCRRYSDDPARYPHYDNYDAIEVSKVRDIPEDYWGVPITFLDSYNPEHFRDPGHHRIQRARDVRRRLAGRRAEAVHRGESEVRPHFHPASSAIRAYSCCGIQ